MMDTILLLLYSQYRQLLSELPSESSNNVDFYVQNGHRISSIDNSSGLQIHNEYNTTDSNSNSTQIPNGTFPLFPTGIMSHQDLLNFILRQHPEYRLAESLNQYGYMTEVIVGTLANIVALVVMLSLARLPVCNYMAGLALADLSVVLGPCLIRWLLTYDLDPRVHNTATCRLLNFTTYWSFSVSAWILVAMTFDRYLAISFPLKALIHSTPCRARLTVFAIVAVVAIVNVHLFFTLEVTYDASGVVATCVAKEKYRNFMDDVWPWLDATIYSFLPFFFLLIFNFLIIKNHAQAVRVNSSLKGSVKGEIPNPGMRSTRKMTVTLLMVSFTFIIMTAPRAILHIIRPTVFNFTPEPQVLDFKILARYTLTASLVNLLMYGNHCINFFLYCLTGNRFRQQLIHIFQTCCKRKLRRIHPANMDSIATEMTSSRRRCSSESSTLSWRSDSTKGKGGEGNGRDFQSAADQQTNTTGKEGHQLNAGKQMNGNSHPVLHTDRKLVSIREENVDTVNKSTSCNDEPVSSV